MKNLLYIDGCVSRENSRTEKLAQACLRRILASDDCRMETVVLEDAGLTALDGAMLKKRERWIGMGDFSDDYFRFAKTFAAADVVVFAVPYWDLAFPALFKVYLEHLAILNLTFRYTEDGHPVGLTRVRKVLYVTTAGGFIGRANFGFEYVKGLMQNLFGIADVRFVGAEGLDICGHDPRGILEAAIRTLQTKTFERRPAEKETGGPGYSVQKILQKSPPELQKGPSCGILRLKTLLKSGPLFWRMMNHENFRNP